MLRPDHLTEQQEETVSTPKPNATPNPTTLPPKLQRVHNAAKRLAETRAARDSWVKTALALSYAEVKRT